MAGWKACATAVVSECAPVSSRLPLGRPHSFAVRVSIRNLTKRFGPAWALERISLEIESQELFFLLGPSGCGKTTLLRTLAGFYQPDSGELFFGDKPVNGVPPHQRNTGMVFQNYALWPHLTVADNVAYGLEVRKVSTAERMRRVAEALAIVQMEPFADRTPNQLSGGQQQRVALARALVIQPDVLLLDEPLSNLDAKLRLEMREEIRRIHAQTKITTIYVTHDQKEALSLAHRMAVLRDGHIEQLGTPRAVYRHPVNRFVADFIGETNWLSATVRGCDGGEMTVETDGGVFVAATELSKSPGEKVWLGFRPEAVEIGTDSVNALDTRIAHVSYLGEIEQYRLAMPSGALVKAFEQNPRELRQVGAPLRVHVRPQNCLVLPE
ncbi:MAG: ABC transporter ATP-binding protein [Verrucomicrobia bacterium]|nr:ABC transporter ATP-binding protein [Verrucomicrobiota bacterium]